MPFIIVFAIALLVGLVFPTGVGAVLWIANMLLPDPIPFVDEVGIGIGVLARSIRSRKKLSAKNMIKK